MNKLQNKRVAILATDGFEEVELTVPKKALEDAGAETVMVSIKEGKLKAWDKTNWGGEYDVDKVVTDVSADDFDGLLLPGGVLNPDQLRMNKDAVDFTSRFIEQGKPIAAICHGPQILIETQALQGRVMTSYPSLKTDLQNAGVRWENKSVVVDGALTTSRTPDDLDDFCEKMIEELAEGKHEEMKTTV